MSDNTETAILAGGCFWGVQELLRQRDGSHLDPGRIHRWGERQPDLPQPSRSRRGGRDRLRPRADLLPGHPRVLLPDPRPDDQGPPGQRRRLQLPLGDLLHERRAAPGRRGHDRRRRGLGPVARQGRDRDQRGRPLLGGRARAPGLPPAHPERLHLPLPAAGLEAAPPRDRGLTARGSSAQGREPTRAAGLAVRLGARPVTPGRGCRRGSSSGRAARRPRHRGCRVAANRLGRGSRRGALENRRRLRP